MNRISYQEAWSFLDKLQFFKIKLGLDSMNHFLGLLGNPHRDLAFVHIGGTNGKGSVGSTIATILTQSGYNVGLYTSPHLSSVRERFKICNRYISEDEFAFLADKIINVLNNKQITYFEFTTTLALLWFAWQKVDLAVMEVGMGGRLDATNVIKPLVSIITNVTFDHEQYLGTTIKEIATEKAGIIKDRVPVVSGVDNDIARQIIENTCQDHKSPLYLLGRDYFADNKNSSVGTWSYHGINDVPVCKPWNFNDLPIVLKGDYQIDNSAIALAALELLSAKKFNLNENDIRTGLSLVVWPGRLEEFWKDAHNNIWHECPANYSQSLKHFLLDGAHNKAGITALKEILKRYYARKKLILVWAAMADKDFSSTLPSMAELTDTFILTRPESERSASPEQLKNILPSNIREKVYCYMQVEEAINKAMELADEHDLICISGSLYLIGKARQYLLGDLVKAA